MSKVLWALQNVSDFKRFERLCVDILYRHGHHRIQPMGGSGDRGIDAITYNYQDEPGSSAIIYQFSTHSAPRTKLREELAKLQRITETIPVWKYIYVTNRNVSSRTKLDLTLLYSQSRFQLDIFDLEWLRVRLENDHLDLVHKYLLSSIDESSRLTIDSIALDVNHNGICVRSGTQWWEGSKPDASPSLSIALSNLGTKELVIVPRIEVLKRAVFESSYCTFPNDPVTGAGIEYFENTVNLEADQSLFNVLSTSLQLKPKETNALKLAFIGCEGFCYKIQFRVFWKVLGKDMGTTTLSGCYYINHAKGEETWEQQIRDAIMRRETVSVRLATGWDSFENYIKTLETNNDLVRRCKIGWASGLEEFILLGSRTVIITEIPPQDRYLESSSYSRRGILTHAREIVSKYESAYKTRS